jgi:propanediol dehydratase small subunit
MSDEIKKPEVVNTTEEKQLDEKALDEVVGGKLHEAAVKGTHIPEVTIEF